MKNNYLFTSSRLGFRNWLKEDLTAFAELNADKEVMEHFPKTLTKLETEDLLQRLQKQYDERGYTYFATELLATGELIGFIGLCYQDYETTFNPSVDIGWRLKKSFWGKGYATEGAKKCLAYGFDDLELKRIIAVCTINNTKSSKVMEKIGMKKQGEFAHPKLKDYPKQERCVWYEITN